MSFQKEKSLFYLIYLFFALNISFSLSEERNKVLIPDQEPIAPVDFEKIQIKEFKLVFSQNKDEKTSNLRDIKEIERITQAQPTFINKALFSNDNSGIAGVLSNQDEFSLKNIYNIRKSLDLGDIYKGCYNARKINDLPDFGFIANFIDINDYIAWRVLVDSTEEDKEDGILFIPVFIIAFHDNNFSANNNNDFLNGLTILDIWVLRGVRGVRYGVE